MKFLRRGTASSSESTDATSASDDGAEAREAVVVGDRTRSQTAGKGRPTPSRRDAEGKKRGPVAPAPKNQREAIKRAKSLRGSKEDRRSASAERRKRMMAGDDAVLMPRDRGPARAYARDIVDGRRNLMGLFMPLAVVIFVTVIVPVPAVQTAGSLICLIMLVMMALEGVLLGRLVVSKVRAKFPDEQVGGLSYGWYAFTRATQIRKLRMPAPRVARGTQVT
ncbi:DUF3043 domain-containing protein [Actinomycetospora lutea]|uniref:DUF3043 domain-containing protein n=1 Tax=Actinomycetospora lutea TaxID=663604 RepID=UPI00236500C6|nr:DUF3043 domain-containing protein [Actinomycetospora lutea]MDD7940489.1 DUF3043 domain-containing protein [Actinomycetospora lutea]